MAIPKTVYWKIWKCPSSHQRIRKTITVPRQPQPQPPDFFAPYPATSARSNLLMHVLQAVPEFTHWRDRLDKMDAVAPANSSANPKISIIPTLSE